MLEKEEKKKIVARFLNSGLLVSPEFFDAFKEGINAGFLERNDDLAKQDILSINKDVALTFDNQHKFDVNWFDFEKARVDKEKGRPNHYDQFLEFAGRETAIAKENTESTVKEIFSYTTESKKRDIQDFVKMFNARYNSIAKILRGRQELKNVVSISRLKNKKERESVSVIGLVKEKQLTKNQNFMLEVEDPTGIIKVLVNKNKPDQYDQAKDIVLDEVIGISGVNGDNILFSNNLIWPDVPYSAEPKKCVDDVSAVFLSDLHIGSNKFLEEEFKKFIKWINCDMGNEAQKEEARKVKYIFIAGDLIDGCGIYPSQETELKISDIYEQYEECSKYLAQIPEHISIILCPGNHDAMRIAEPQPPIYPDFAASLYDLKNVRCLSNPCFLNIHSNDNFSGFNILMYHGYSFDHFIADVDSIRQNGGYDRADLVMKFLLKKRHLAPTHTSTQYIPDSTMDPLVIETVPDFFITGHLHKTSVSNYKGVTMICGSCWQSKTAFQEKVGHNPEPGRVPIVNLSTREIKIMKFFK